MRIEADYQNIDHERKDIAPGVYRAVIKEIEDKPSKSGLPMLTFTLKIDDTDAPLETDKEVRDYIVTQTKERKPNKLGLGQLKAYAIAIMGDDYANGSGIDTDDLLAGVVTVEIGQREYTAEPTESNPNPEVQRFPTVKKVVSAQ